MNASGNNAASVRRRSAGFAREPQFCLDVIVLLMKVVLGKVFFFREKPPTYLIPFPLPPYLRLLFLRQTISMGSSAAYSFASTISLPISQRPFSYLPSLLTNVPSQEASSSSSSAGRIEVSLPRSFPKPSSSSSAAAHLIVSSSSRSSDESGGDDAVGRTAGRPT